MRPDGPERDKGPPAASGLERRNSQLVASALGRWAEFCFSHPRLVLALVTLLVVASLGLASARLDLRMEWTYLFAADDPVVTKFLAARELFPYPSDIVVLVDGGEARQRELYLDRLSERLTQEPSLFFHVFYRWDLSLLCRKALYYLPPEQLQELADLLSQPAGGASQGLPPAIETVVLRELDRTLRTRGQEQPTVLREILAAYSDAGRADTLLSFLNGQRMLYSTLDGGRIHLLILKTGTRGVRLDARGESIDRLRAILAEMASQATALRVRLTGLPVLLHDERVTCARDSARAAVLAMLLSSLILVAGFGQWRAPLQAVVAVLCGMALSLGYATVAVGHLNFVTATVASMLSGLGLDFAIQFLFRFEEECGQGSSSQQAVVTTAQQTGLDNLLGDLTTAVAFGSLTLVEFRGIAELGIIVAGGVACCYLSVLSVLPALLGWLKPGPTPERRPARYLVALERGLLSHSREISWLGLLLLLAGLAWAPKVGFDENLLEVQAAGLESVRTEEEMIADLGRSALSASVVVSDESQARALVARLECLSAVESVSSLTQTLPPDIAFKRPLVARIVAAAGRARLPQEIPLEGASDLRALAQAARARGGGEASDPELNRARVNLENRLHVMGPGPIQDGLALFQSAARRDLQMALDFLALQVTSPPTPEDFPEEMRVRYLGEHGHYLVQVQPAQNVWQRPQLERFLDQVATVTPNLMGHPVVQRHILTSFREAFLKAPWYTVCGVFLFMAFSVRRLRDLALALLPTLLGVVGILGAMGVCGTDFNVVNFVALPICVGIGAVYGVHSLSRMAELGAPRLLTSSTGRAIFLSGLTTLAGFWTLTTADHRGIASLGWVISVGVAVHLWVSLVLLPALVNAVPLARRSILGAPGELKEPG